MLAGSPSLKNVGGCFEPHVRSTAHHQIREAVIETDEERVFRNDALKGFHSGLLPE